jgi:TfoX/Sxy family transcriptional regulator of competence genes
MAYDEHLADRVRNTFKRKRTTFEEKKMMGGLCFLVDDKMCVGVHESRLMARIDPEVYEAALKRKGCEKMLFTGKEMKGYVFVHPPGTDLDKDLESWIQLSLDFNPKAKSSKRQKGGKAERQKGK